MFSYIGNLIKSAGEIVGGIVISLGLMLGGSTESPEDTVIQPVETIEQSTTTQNIIATTSEVLQIDTVENGDIVESEKIDSDVEVVESEPKQTVPIEISKSKNSISEQPIPIDLNTVNKEVNLKDFSVRCSIDDDGDRIHTGDQVHTELNLFEGQNPGLSSHFDIKWFRSDKKLPSFLNEKEANFTFSDPGNYSITVSVTRKSDGFIKSDKCDVYVYCNDYECLSTEDKKKSKLNSIINEIKDWYEEDNITYACTISESIIRALEYDYTLLGGKNLPGFNPDVDCATTVAPAAYEYKIQSLLNSL